MNAARIQRKPTWRSGEDFRIVCNCQAHARRERTLLRRTMRVAGNVTRRLKARGIALIVGVPLAFGALELPTEATNIPFGGSLWREHDQRVIVSPRTPLAQLQSAQIQVASSPFRIFTTSQVREQFLDPHVRNWALTPDSVREHFFKTYVPYGSIIYAEAVRNNLPPELVAAVVEAESDFRPRLISNKNAQGLMQIIPSTGRLMGAADLFNPSENIAAGTKYLRYLFNRFGDQQVVLAAYNAGEGNVEKFRGVPPFPETQNYLRRVSARSNHYHQRVRVTYLTSMRMRKSIATQ